MRTIGLTGGIACGKSNVSDCLAGLGARIIDGDRISHALTQADGAALPGLIDAFGAQILHADGALDRAKLGRLVFSDDKARETLDGLMQPLIRREILLELEAARTDGTALCVLDMPLLYEKGLDPLCDSVWCVYLDEETQLARLMARSGCTKEEALARVRSQMSVREKAALADIVIDTSGSIAQTRAMIPALFREELGKEAGHGNG